MADLSDEEELRHRLDMHQLISHHPNGSYSTGDSPPQTADQVIEEIDRMLQVLFFLSNQKIISIMSSAYLALLEAYSKCC